MRIGTRIRRAAAAAAIAGLGLAGCSNGGGGAAGGDGGVLRIGVSAAIDSLNPFVSSSDYSSVMYQYVYPHLVEYDTATMKLVPSFATEWKTSTDSKTWTFTTTAGATWSDGTPLTAKDAAFTLNMILKYKDGPTGQLAGFTNHLSKAEATSDTELVLSYEQPVANVLAQMQALPILPEAVWSQYATGDGKGIMTFQNGTPMVSGGPFQLQEYKKNQIALFQRNPKWWGKEQPHLQGFGLQMFANADAMVTALKTKQVDMIGEATPATAVDTLKQAGLDVETTPSTGFYNLIINTSTKKKDHKELLNPKVREAFEYASDRASMVQTAWLGLAESGSTIVAPATGFHDDSIKALPYDLAKAGEILDSLGFKKGSDGIRVADGAKMNYDVVFPTEINGAGDRMFQILQNSFKELGVGLVMKKMDSDAAEAEIFGNDNTYDTYDLAMWDWVPPVDPDFQLSVLTCDQRGNNNDSGYCNPAYDKLYAEQGAAATEAKRREIINQMQQIAFDDRPYIVLLYQPVIEARSDAYTGYLMSPLVGSVNNLSTQTLMQVKKAG